MWIVVGDFNNVLKNGDRIGGTDVHLAEYIDMELMMRNTNLFEHDTIGPIFTWSNRQTSNPICSRIDKALVNTDWISTFPNSEIEVLNPHISDHSPLRINMDCKQPTRRIKHQFKFLNCVVDHLEFLSILKTNGFTMRMAHKCITFGRIYEACNTS